MEPSSADASDSPGVIGALAWALDRGRTLAGLVTTAAVTLLMAFITVRLALAGGWFEAAVAGVCAVLGTVTLTRWYGRLRS